MKHKNKTGSDKTARMSDDDMKGKGTRQQTTMRQYRVRQFVLFVKLSAVGEERKAIGQH